jgi:GNAT superfamily N-acetyltransferase
MGWNLTSDLEEYAAAAGDFLHADPAENTVVLGLIETLRAQGTDGTRFGWWRSGGGGVGGVFQHTDPHPMLLSAMPDDAARELAGVLAERDSAFSVTGAPGTVSAFADRWQHRTGMAAVLMMRQRLYRLEGLAMPHPPPPGTARVADTADRDLLVAWFDAFERESLGSAAGIEALVDDRLSHDGIALWEVDGRPVAVASRTRVVAGMARIGSVYTPPEHRRHGYGAAVTATLSRAALDAGARHVVLFTDLANPTSNSIYQRLGYRPLSDRLVLGFSGRTPSAPSRDRSGTA